MAYYLVNRLQNPDLLPDKYIHTFLIRDPKKSVYSLYKMSLNKELTGEFCSVNNNIYILTDVIDTTRPWYDLDPKMSLNKELTGRFCSVNRIINVVIHLIEVLQNSIMRNHA